MEINGAQRIPTRLLSQQFLVGVVCILALAACGGSGGSSAPPPPATPPPANPPPATPAPPSAPADPILYIATQDDVDTFELYLVDPAAPGVSSKVNGPLAADGDVGPYGLSPDLTKAAYMALEDSPTAWELYLVDLATPGASTKLNSPLVAGGEVLAFEFDPDGTHIAYLANQDDVTLAELYLVDLANPGVSVKLNGALPPSGGVTFGFGFNADGTRILYAADKDIEGVFELYVVDVATPGVATKVNPAFTADTNLVDGFTFSPDGATIGYTADQDVDGRRELYAVAADALGVATKLNAPLVSGGDLCAFRFSPDSTQVAYCADQDVDGTIELYLVTLAVPGVSMKLNSPLATNGDVSAQSYRFSADGSFIVYRADQDTDGVFELYRVEVATPGTTAKINAPLVAGGDVSPAVFEPAFRISPDGTQLSYIADQDTDDVLELYGVDLATPGAAGKLSPPMASDGVVQLAMTADGATVIYQALQEGPFAELYRVAIASPGVSTKLSDALTANGSVLDFSNAPGVHAP